MFGNTASHLLQRVMAPSFKWAHFGHFTLAIQYPSALSAIAGGLQIPRFGKSLKGTVVRLFRGFRETASGQLLVGKMAVQTIAAVGMIGATRIGAGAAGHVCRLFGTVG